MADKKRRSFNDLLMNNKFVFVVSVLMAVALWAVISMTVGDSETRVIENVKVTVEQDEESLYKIFGYKDTYVDITVKGKKYLVSPGALSAEDILVTASGSYVDSAGTKKLNLTASIDKSSDIKITGMSKSNIYVYFDIPKTETFPVEASLKSSGNITPGGYLSEDPILSATTVKVTGPATEINKIEKFTATAKIKTPLTETTEIKVKLTPVVTDGEKVSYIELEDAADKFTVTVPVSKIKEIPVSVRYVDIPAYYEKNMPEVNIYPKTVKVAAAESVVDSLESINVGTINFNELTNTNNSFKFTLENIDEVKIIDPVKEVSVNVNCYPMKQKTLNVFSDNITLLNIPDGKISTLITNKIENVTVIGTEDEIKKLNDDDVFAKVDLSNVKAGTQSFTATVYIKNSDKCWAYGKYTVKVRTE